MAIPSWFRPSAAVSVALLLVGFLLMAPAVAVGMGYDLSSQTDGTVVGDPTTDVSSDATVVAYDSLSDDEQATFDEALGTSESAVGTIEGAEYVELNGDFYPITAETTQSRNADWLLYSAFALGGIVTTVGSVAAFSTVGMPLYRELVGLVGPYALTAFWTAVVAAVGWTVAVPVTDGFDGGLRFVLTTVSSLVFLVAMTLLTLEFAREPDDAA